MTDPVKLETAAKMLSVLWSEPHPIDGWWIAGMEGAQVDLCAALEAEPAQENTQCSQCGFTGPHGHTHQGKPSALTQDSAPGDASEEAMEIRDQIDHGCDGIAANAVDVIATALTKAHAAGRRVTEDAGDLDFSHLLDDMKAEAHAAGRVEMASWMRDFVEGNKWLEAEDFRENLLAKLPEADHAQPSDQ